MPYVHTQGHKYYLNFSTARTMKICIKCVVALAITAIFFNAAIGQQLTLGLRGDYFYSPSSIQTQGPESAFIDQFFHSGADEVYTNQGQATSFKNSWGAGVYTRFWYSKRKYGSFIFGLDFAQTALSLRSSQPHTLNGQLIENYSFAYQTLDGSFAWQLHLRPQRNSFFVQAGLNLNLLLPQNNLFDPTLTPGTISYVQNGTGVEFITERVVEDTELPLNNDVRLFDRPGTAGWHAGFGYNASWFSLGVFYHNGMQTFYRTTVNRYENGNLVGTNLVEAKNHRIAARVSVDLKRRKIKVGAKAAKVPRQKKQKVPKNAPLPNPCDYNQYARVVNKHFIATSEKELTVKIKEVDATKTPYSICFNGEAFLNNVPVSKKGETINITVSGQRNNKLVVVAKPDVKKGSQLELTVISNSGQILGTYKVNVKGGYSEALNIEFKE